MDKNGSGKMPPEPFVYSGKGSLPV